MNQLTYPIAIIVAIFFMALANACQKAKSTFIDPAAQFPDSVSK